MSCAPSHLEEKKTRVGVRREEKMARNTFCVKMVEAKQQHRSTAGCCDQFSTGSGITGGVQILHVYNKHILST